MKKRKFGLATLVIIIIVAIAFLNSIVNFIVNIKWFKEVGYLSVYFTKLLAILKLMVPIFILVYLGIWIYYKSLREILLS